ELTQLLQVEVLLFGEQFDAEIGGHIRRAVLGLELLARVERLAVVAEAPAAPGAFRRAIEEHVLARLLALADDIGLATGLLHLMQRPKLVGPGLEPRLHLGPGEALVPRHVLLEARSQRREQSLAIRRRQCVLAHDSGHWRPPCLLWRPLPCSNPPPTT